MHRLRLIVKAVHVGKVLIYLWYKLKPHVNHYLLVEAHHYSGVHQWNEQDM